MTLPGNSVIVSMDKDEFVQRYSGKITTHFSPFFWSDEIQLRVATRITTDFLDYYLPWYQKDGHLNRTIEQVLNDPKYLPIRFSEVKNYPKIIARCGDAGVPSTWEPFPVATDVKLKKTLVLDGNKTICRLLQDEARLEQPLDVVEVLGEDLHRLVTDFHILSRR